MEPIDDLIEECAKKGIKITYSSIIGKALANMYHESNNFGRISFGNYVKAETMDFTMAVDIEGKDIYNLTFRDASNKSILQIAEEISDRVKKIKLK